MRKKMTGILEALLGCDINKLKAILEGGQDVNYEIPGTEGCSPLHIVVGIENSHGKDNLLSYLLEKGANPNARSYDDLTPVHIAAMWNNCYELEKLLQSGGNPWLTDNENKNSFDMAADNNAYEAFQLLNKYLAENKLNFKPIRDPFKNYAETKNLKECPTDKILINPSVSLITNTAFLTANEHFPLFLSSSEDETESFVTNISKFLKRQSLKKQIIKQINLTDKSNINDNYNKTMLKDDIRHSELISHSDIKEHYFADSTKSQKRKLLDKKENPLYESSFSFCDSKILTSKANVSGYNDDRSETVLLSDNENSIVLVEKCFSKCDINLDKNKDLVSDTLFDWKSGQISSNDASFLSSCSSHSEKSVIVSAELQRYSNSKIFQELQNLGDHPGPVLNHTRNVYLRRLARLMSGCTVSCDLPEPKFCPEVYLFLEGKLDMIRLQNMEKVMTEEFANSCLDIEWREGNQRCCFNYFLLDPRITQNLPFKAQEQRFEDTFLVFLNSLFYVGKGTQKRPYSHLHQAAKAMDNAKLESGKIVHILDIWKAGLGVISLHCFNNSIPAEAYTREACIIEAIGLKNLTNVKNGDFYGQCSKWTKSRKRQIGLFLLKKALQIFLLDGEKQIKPQNI